MLLWKDLIKNQDKNKEVFLKFSKKTYDKHCEQNTADYEKLPPIKIDQALLSNVGNDQHESMGANFYEGDLESDVYTKSILKVSEYENNHMLTQTLNLTFNKKFGFVLQNTQEPGQVVAPHVDANRRFSNLCTIDFSPDDLFRTIIFLEDWKLGQMFTIGKSSLTDWKKHDCIKFPWYIPHATANASAFNRNLLSYIGI
jgi:hypothetical protein